MDQKSLIQRILDASSTIANSANRGAANHLVVSSFIADEWKDLFKNERRKEKIEELWGISNNDTTKHT